MRREAIYFILFLIIVLAALFLQQYVFNIYETEIKVSSSTLYADNSSTSIIKTIPINAFGVKAPLRNSGADFKIIEGQELIEIVEINNKKGLIKIRAKDKTGQVVIYVKPDKALLPTSITIIIKPNVV